MAIAGSSWIATADTNAATALQGPAPKQISVEVAAWSPRPFAEVVLDAPELAACFQLSPGWWTLAQKPPIVPDATALATTLAQAVVSLGIELPDELKVTVAGGEVTRPAAVAFGNTVLLMLPGVATDSIGAVPAIAQALLAAALRPAPANPNADEPLVALGEALAFAGSYSLASLPPALRPVHDWLERREASPALASLVSDALDASVPWQVRRARLVRVGQPDGATPELAHAAAYLLEAFGDAGRARRDPLSFLLAWRDSGRKPYPAFPGVLRRALAKPLQAGLPAKPAGGDESLLATAPLSRQLENGNLPAAPPDAEVPLAIRMLGAAIARTTGSETTCRWITPAVPADLRTGCRSDGEKPGFVYTRPLASGGSEIVERSLTGDEGPLLRWPRWSLFPSVLPAQGALVFVDPEGIWDAPLDGRSTPRLVLAGAFRHLAPSHDGTVLAAVRWPSGSVVLLTPKGNREVRANGSGGIAWVEDDVLLASDGRRLTMTSLEAESVPWPTEVPCSHSLAADATLILATVSPPCEAAVMRLARLDGKVARVLQLARDAIGIVLLPQGGLVFGDSEGLWRWRGGDHAERVGLGFTPGPG